MLIIQDFGGSVQAYVAHFARIVSLRPACCPHCGQRDRLIGHGFYWRKAKDQTQVIRMRVKRWLCKTCRSTLSLLPSFVLRFRHYLLAVIQAVIVAHWQEHPIGTDSTFVTFIERNQLLTKFDSHVIISLSISSILLLAGNGASP